MNQKLGGYVPMRGLVRQFDVRIMEINTRPEVSEVNTDNIGIYKDGEYTVGKLTDEDKGRLKEHLQFVIDELLN